MVGSEEFQKYCEQHNIPKSYRVWTWAMWKHLEEKFTSTNSDMVPCLWCNGTGWRVWSDYKESCIACGGMGETQHQ